MNTLETKTKTKKQSCKQITDPSTCERSLRVLKVTNLETTKKTDAK